jgi:hypothetical protein
MPCIVREATYRSTQPSEFLALNEWCQGIKWLGLLVGRQKICTSTLGDHLQAREDPINFTLVYWLVETPTNLNDMITLESQLAQCIVRGATHNGELLTPVNGAMRWNGWDRDAQWLVRTSNPRGDHLKVWEDAHFTLFSTIGSHSPLHGLAVTYASDELLAPCQEV